MPFGMRIGLLLCAVSVLILSIPSSSGIAAPSSDLRWVFETVDSDRVATGAQVAMGADGSIHLAYMANMTMRYATESRGNWSVKTIDSDSGSYDFSLAIDSHGTPYIIESNYYEMNFTYMAPSGGTWKMYSVSTGYLDHGSPLLGFDSANNMHIVFISNYIIWNQTSGYGQTAGSLIHMTNAGGAWTSEVIENISERPSAPSMAIDSSDKIHLAYCSTPINFTAPYYVNSTLRYATDADGHWKCSQLDSTGSLDYYYGYARKTYVAVDADGHTHVSYGVLSRGSGFGSLANATLKYATDRGGEWNYTTVDKGFRVSGMSSLVLDSQGFPHISYYDGYNEDPMYAAYNGTGWHIERLQTVGRTGYESSLVIDSKGRAHVFFLDETKDYFSLGNIELVHATQVPVTHHVALSTTAAYGVAIASIAAVVCTALVLWRLRW